MGRPTEIIETMEQARREIYRGKARYALRLVDEMGEELDRDFPRTVAWAEWALVRAEAITGMFEDAESYFIEAFERIEKLPKEQQDQVRLKLRANEIFAAFLDGNRRASEARVYFAEAKKLATQIRDREAAARLELKIVQIDLKLSASPQLANFKVMMSVAGENCDEQDRGFTRRELLAAWCLHLGEVTKYTGNRKAARAENRATSQYFQKLLDRARDTAE